MIYDITKKQQELILLLYKFRFLNRVQFQTLLKHKTFNRIIVWLNDLVAKGYVGKITDTTSKITTTPTIYHIEKRGIQFLNAQESCEKKYIARMYREKNKSKEFRDRCLSIVDIYIDLLKRYGTSPDFSFYTPSNYAVGSIIRDIFPQFVYRRGEIYYVGEFIKEKPRKAIRGRINTYIRFYTSEEGKQYSNVSKFLLICPNEQIEEYVIRYATKTLTEENTDLLKFHVSTREQIGQYGIEGKIWNRVTAEH